jgi:hypothetical protein
MKHKLIFNLEKLQARCACKQWSFTLQGKGELHVKKMWHAFDFHCIQCGVK